MHFDPFLLKILYRMDTDDITINSISPFYCTKTFCPTSVKWQITGDINQYGKIIRITLGYNFDVIYFWTDTQQQGFYMITKQLIPNTTKQKLEI